MIRTGKHAKLGKRVPHLSHQVRLWMKNYIGLYEIVRPNLKLFFIVCNSLKRNAEKNLLILCLNFRLYNFVSVLTVKRITRISQQNKFQLNREKQTAVGRPRKRNRVLIQFLSSVNRSPWSLYSSKLRGIRT